MIGITLVTIFWFQQDLDYKLMWVAAYNRKHGIVTAAMREQIKRDDARHVEDEKIRKLTKLARRELQADISALPDKSEPPRPQGRQWPWHRYDMKIYRERLRTMPWWQRRLLGE
jgi:hypothetical protein